MRISDWSSDVCSSDLAAGAQSDAENKYAVGLSLGSGVQMTGTDRIDTQGSLTTTNNSLDLAIEGSGYFPVEMPAGTIGYTCQCNFSLTSEGVVVTSDGLPLARKSVVKGKSVSLRIDLLGRRILKKTK